MSYKDEYLIYTGSDITDKDQSYGDFQPVSDSDSFICGDTKLFIRPKEMSGGDYAGSYYNKSNYICFLEKFKDVSGVYDISGGYGTYAIVIRKDVAKNHEGIKECLKALDSYPVINEDHVSQMQLDAEEIAFPDLVHEVTEHLKTLADPTEKVYGKLVTEQKWYPENPDWYTYKPTEDELKDWLWEAMEALNIYFEMDDYNAYLDGDELMPYILDMILIKSKASAPLLIGHKWCAECFQSMFEDLLKGA